jgi:hypothetical protein
MKDYVKFVVITGIKNKQMLTKAMRLCQRSHPRQIRCESTLKQNLLSHRIANR